MLKLPSYTKRDIQMLLWAVLPFALILNIVLFGNRYFKEGELAAKATLITYAVIGSSFFLYRYIGVNFRERFPGDGDFFKRTMPLILVLLLTSALIIYGLVNIYKSIGLIAADDFDKKFTWAYLVTGILNIFFTFLNEGLFTFERWKNDHSETEDLKSAYKQGQLMGLRSQVNPHFLFNSLNSLSGLIAEDTDKAGKFLDEMSRVYRYMLRNEDEQLVLLAQELEFIQSYFALLKARYNKAIEFYVDITEEDKKKWLPPLSLQVVIENALFQNKTSKDSPLVISIVSASDDAISILNNVQRKVMADDINYEAGLDNLVRKYKLMNQPLVEIREESSKRMIRLPLLPEKKEVLL